MPHPQSADNRQVPQPETQFAEVLFDRTTAAQRLGSEALLKKVAILFLKNVPDSLEEIRQSIAQSDSARLERSAHTLASSMAYLSAKPASDAALALEEMGHSGDLSDAAIAHERLDAEVERLKRALSALVQ